MYSGTYTHAGTQCPYSTSDVEATSSFPSPLPLPLLTIPNPDPLAAVAEFDSAKPLGHYPDVSHSSTSSSGGSSCYSSPSSFPSAETGSGPSLFQRSISSASLQRNDGGYYHYSPLAMSALELAESETSPVRRVYSTGDLQRVNGPQHKQRSESPLMSESNMIIEGMSRACPYSPEEKKERIERYRSKRSQRNFNKKIKYACRKTLADSRPRIRGRFARNDEIYKCDQLPWSHEAGGEDEEEDEEDNWVNLLDSFTSGNLYLPEH